MHHGQSQAGALANGLGGEEGIEYPGEDLVAHAAPGIAHAQAHEVAHGQGLALGLGRVQALVAQDDTDAPAVGHGVAGV